jgi:hypothetical protein
MSWAATLICASDRGAIGFEHGHPPSAAGRRTRIFHQTGAGGPSNPRGLAELGRLGYANLPSGERWLFTGPSGEEQSIRVGGPLGHSRAQAGSLEGVPRGQSETDHSAISG